MGLWEGLETVSGGYSCLIPTHPITQGRSQRARLPDGPPVSFIEFGNALSSAQMLVLVGQVDSGAGLVGDH